MKYTFLCNKCGIQCNSNIHVDAPFYIEHGDPDSYGNSPNGTVYEDIYHNVMNYTKCDGAFYRVYKVPTVIFKGKDYVGKVG